MNTNTNAQKVYLQKQMERIRQGINKKEEEIFRFFDELRRKRFREPKAVILALQAEMGIEPRLGVIYLQRYTKAFGDPDANNSKR